jgi:hypothetical protein
LVEVHCPWGNRMFCYEPEPRFGYMRLGIPYVELEVPRGSTGSIAAFYQEIFDLAGKLGEDEQGRFLRLPVGVNQNLFFREVDNPNPDYDNHHIQVYVTTFSAPHAKLKARDLVFEETNQYQYRFKDIVDPDTNQPVFALEHEVRSVTSPMYLRPLVNRNPEQTLSSYVPGLDAWQ